MGTPPRAQGKRLHWEDLPDEVRARFEAAVGPVVDATTVTSGFSPGMAATLTLASGERVFAKAVSGVPNDVAPRIQRQEIRVARQLPAGLPVPSLRWWWEAEDPLGWVLLVLDHVNGRSPVQPWDPAEFAQVVNALNGLTHDMTPSPISAADLGVRHGGSPLEGGWWQRFRDEGLIHPNPWVVRNLDALVALESLVPQLTPGTTLLHMDLRGDNMLITAEGVVIVDWPHATIGPAWLDGVFFAPSVAMEGGPEPEELVQLLDALRDADPTELTIGIAETAGFFTYQGALPDVPGLPGLRQFQEAQGVVARRWLACRPDWGQVE